MNVLCLSIDLNLMIVEAYRVVIQTCSQAVNEYEYGLLPLMGLLSKKGLQAVCRSATSQHAHLNCFHPIRN